MIVNHYDLSFWKYSKNLEYKVNEKKDQEFKVSYLYKYMICHLNLTMTNYKDSIICNTCYVACGFRNIQILEI